MFGYYLNLALRSFKRNKALTVLMVLAIALGIGASMTTLTVFYVLSGDPIPQKSDKLFYPRIDPRSANGFTPGDEPEDQFTRYDAERLLLADEPTGNLDTQMARGVMELLEEINRAGTTIVMVTHDPELAARAQRNVHIVDGMATDLSIEPGLARAMHAQPETSFAT